MPGLSERVGEGTDPLSTHIRLVSDGFPDAQVSSMSGLIPEPASPSLPGHILHHDSQQATLSFSQQVLDLLMTAATPVMGLEAVAKFLVQGLQVEGCVICDRATQVSSQVQVVWFDKPRLIQKQMEIVSLCQRWLSQSLLDAALIPEMTFLPMFAPIQEAWEGLNVKVVALPSRYAGQVNGGIFLIARKVALTDWQHKSLQVALPAI
ncbi:MAG: hypothetical protein VKJ24_12920, partial [Synechococcales bacterium]|nr:hypothetical protein [Synechococcales bacterium]